MFSLLGDFDSEADIVAHLGIQLDIQFQISRNFIIRYKFMFIV